MSRRVKFGCLGAAVLTLVVLGGWAYFYIIRPAQAVLDDIDFLAGLAPMNETIVNRQPFSPPADDEVSEAQLEAFSRIQNAMMNGLGAEYELLRERSQILMGLFDANGEKELKNVGFRDAIMTIDGLGPVLVRAKELQVDAINSEAFSLDEYRWIREAFFDAMGFSRAHVYFEDFAADLKQGNSSFDMEAAAPDAPPVNRDRASRYSDQVSGWYPFLVFGL